MVRNFRRSGQEPDLSLMSQGEDAYLVLRGVFHVSPPALGGLSIDGKLTFSNNAYLKLPTEWIMPTCRSWWLVRRRESSPRRRTR